MKIVKLNAINSTNAFLKEKLRTSKVENYTVVVTENQTNGKGQYDNIWTSEKGKNLTFSILCKFSNLKIQHSFYLNCAISLAIHTVVAHYIKEKLKIKWPNDILSSDKKLCGILIENTVSNGKIEHAIIGIGLNINQEEFPDTLPNASSLKMLTGKTYDLDTILDELITAIKIQTNLIVNEEFGLLKSNYEQALYRKDKPAMFNNERYGNFLGKILGITYQGKLVVELENETLEKFDLKEIKFI